MRIRGVSSFATDMLKFQVSIVFFNVVKSKVLSIQLVANLTDCVQIIADTGFKPGSRP